MVTYRWGYQPRQGKGRVQTGMMIGVLETREAYLVKQFLNLAT